MLRIILYNIWTAVCLLTYPLSAVEHLYPEVVSRLPHERPAFTQGLAIEGDNLFESTGLYGISSLRLVDLSTGKVRRKTELETPFFAEGIAAFPETLFQLTWKEHRALVYDTQTFKLKNVFLYDGEGWGLCRDGQTLWMSNGSSVLVQRDMRTFKVIQSLVVHQGPREISSLNDLECVNESLYANIFGSDSIIRIDKETGAVTAIVDASHLLSSREKAP